MTPTLYWGSSTWRSIDPELSRIGFRLSFSRLGVLGTLFYLHIIYQSRPWITLYLMSGLLRCVASYTLTKLDQKPQTPFGINCYVHAFRFQTAGRSPITLYTPAIPLFSGHIVSMLLSMGQNHGGGVALASGSSPAQLLSGPPRGE